ncbi:unnamed protein product [Rotaria sp. Silwood1]|nr:unnamed protein product [Rotaria sp. Silwood1]
MAEHEMTLFQVGLAAFYIFLFKLTQQTDLCVLTISANRYRAELKDILGFFSNTLPQRMIIDPHWTLDQLFDCTKELCLKSMRHAHFPYQEMGELQGIQTLFLAEPICQAKCSSELVLKPSRSLLDDMVAKFDMTCSIDYNNEIRSITASLNVSTDLFDAKTISTMAYRFQCLLDQVFISVSSFVCNISLLLEHETELLQQVNMNNKFQYQSNLLLLHEQFANRVEEHPQKLAVVLDNQCLTYGELFYFAQLISYHLINACHIQPNDIVPLCVERSLEMTIGILATLMSHAIYCPLTPNHPQQRLNGILRQTNARCILTHDMTANKFESKTVNLSSLIRPNNIDIIDQSLNVPRRDFDEVAYIIFTSGSTGEPKGVQLTHRNLLLTVASYAYNGSILPTDTALQITPCSFDAHVPELLGCLIMGGTSILLHPDGNMQLNYLTSLVERNQASYMHSVPSHLSIICEQLEKDNAFERLVTLRSLCSSGEAMDIRSLNKFRRNTKATIFNLYGPAECTDVSIYKITQDVKQMIEPTCIGRLSPNLVCRILDPYMQTIIPDGHQIGELFVSGPSVFPGYLNRNDLTQCVLINGLSDRTEPYYKTGDLVRLDAYGSLHYVGRKDFMVKLRGPASFAQTRLYLDERLRFGTSKNSIATYHIPLVYEIIQTSISLKRLEQALMTIIHKHKILRTRLLFDENLGELQQEILDEISPIIIVTEVDNEKDVEKILYDEETNPNLFNLNEGKVFRCHVLRRSTSMDQNLLLISDIIIFNFHHIAFDGASIDIFFEDLQIAYSTDKSLPYCLFDYIDYSIHEKDMKIDDTKEFWKQHLNGFSNSYLSLPYDRCPIENNTRSGQGTTIILKLSLDLVNHILTFLKNHDITLHQMGLTVFYIFLFKLTQETDLAILTVTANRYRAELENLIGVFVNTLPHRIIIKPQMNFISFLEEVKNLVFATLPYAYIPFQYIVSNKTISNLQTLFDVDIQQDNEVTLDSNIYLRSFMIHSTDPNNVAKFDLTCTLHYNVKIQSMFIALNGSTDLFEISTIELMAHRFEYLLNQIFITPMLKSICEYSLVLPHELQLLDKFNNGDPLFEQNNLILPIHQQFAYQAKEHPQKLAIILDEQSLTYAELLYSSQQLAQHLIDQYNVKQGHIIGQCLERSIEMSIGIMAILFSNASYLPLSSQESVERLQLLIDLTQPKCVLTHSFTEKQVENICQTVNISMILYPNTTSTIDIHLNNHTVMNDIAFFIFTSGSTGIPKVVPISHMQFTSQVFSYSQVRLHHNNDITIQMANCSFDEHVHEYMGSFICGATLVLLRPQGNLDMHYLCQTIEKNQATLVDFVPTTMAMMNIPDIVPIGRCLPGRKVFVLDKYGQQIMPDGRNIGEIFLGGIGIFSGYHNQPEESARVLVRLSDSDDIFYRTGDLGKINCNGELLFVGRTDFQVKLRGQRIELGEIEAVIMRLSSDITNCVVIKLNHNNEEHLVAYLQTIAQLDNNMLRDECIKYLPLYMVPSLFVLLDRFPLNPNGKLDRKALPSPDFSLLLSSNVTVVDDEPRTDIERQVSSIWSQILHLTMIPSINMNFFKLGGNSLLLMKLHHAYQTQFHYSVNISDLFRHSTIIDHAQLLQSQQLIIEPQWHSFHVSKGNNPAIIDMNNIRELVQMAF